MANKKHKREDYPIVKYRIVTGNGYTVCNSEEELHEALKRSAEFCEKLKEDADYNYDIDIERFRPKYIIKVTEEYIEIN